MEKYIDEDYVLSKLKELQFEKLTAEDEWALETHLKRGPLHWIIGLAMVAGGICFLAWGWIFSHNGTGYAVAATMFSVIFFAVAWTAFLRKPNAKAKGAIHGEIVSYRYEASKTDCNTAADYYADIVFDSSKQRISNVHVPEGYQNKGEGTAKDKHYPQNGAEIIIYKCDSKYPYTFVYPECADHTMKLYAQE